MAKAVDIDAEITPPIVVETAKSPAMETTWNKLRNSAGYRPLLFASWTQEAIDINEEHRLRLHGDEALVDFWEGVLGMPLVFEQPNLDRPEENHLYFDPGDGRLITVFTNEERQADPSHFLCAFYGEKLFAHHE